MNVEYFLVWVPGNGDHPVTIAAELVQIVRAIDRLDRETSVAQQQRQFGAKQVAHGEGKSVRRT